VSLHRPPYEVRKFLGTLLRGRWACGICQSKPLLSQHSAHSKESGAVSGKNANCPWGCTSVCSLSWGRVKFEKPPILYFQSQTPDMANISKLLFGTFMAFHLHFLSKFPSTVEKLIRKWRRKYVVLGSIDYFTIYNTLSLNRRSRRWHSSYLSCLCPLSSWGRKLELFCFT
jgi:hypothetical protein